MADPDAFWDKVAERYAKIPVRNPAAYETTLDRTRAWLAPTDRVLEIGCGTGSTALVLAPAVAAYTGSDISAAMLEIATRKARGAGQDTLRFVRSPVAYDGDGAPFDAVLAFNLLHLLDDLPGALAHVRGLLEPGGHFISKTPCLGDRNRYLKPVVAALRLIGKAPDTVRFLETGALTDAVARAGFEIRETGDYPARPPSRFIVARRPA